MKFEPQSTQRAQRFEIVGKLDGWVVGRLKKSKPTTPQSNELTQKTTNHTNSTNFFFLKPETEDLRPNYSYICTESTEKKKIMLFFSTSPENRDV